MFKRLRARFRIQMKIMIQSKLRQMLAKTCKNHLNLLSKSMEIKMNNRAMLKKIKNSKQSTQQHVRMSLSNKKISSKNIPTRIKSKNNPIRINNKTNLNQVMKMINRLKRMTSTAVPVKSLQKKKRKRF